MVNARLVMMAALAVVAVTACGGLSPASPADARDPNEYVLPADRSLALGPNATPIACGGFGLDAVLAGDATDPRRVWLKDVPTGGRLDLVWPTGFTVRFRPDGGFDVLNASGEVAIVSGSHVSDACVAGDVYWLDDVVP